MARLSVLGELLRAAAREAPDAEAFRYRGERLTYSDWDTLARGPYRALYDEYADAVSRVLGRKVLTIRAS